MAIPSPEYYPIPDSPETPIQQATGLFIESTESYLEAIQAGMVAARGVRATAVREVARRAELMASSVQMLAGVLYDSDSAKSEEALAGVLFINERMQADFYAPYIEDAQALTDNIDEMGHYVTYAKELLHDPTLPNRTMLQEVAKTTLLSNSYVWMRTLSRGAGTS